MQQKSHSVPQRIRADGVHMETRPMYIEEWLDSLPYIDFNKTTKLLLEATSATNRESVKPEVRLELIKLYNRPYQYYLRSQIKPGAGHTLQSTETMQDQIFVLKQIAVNLAQACKISIEEGQTRRTVWRQKKPPLPAIVMQMTYLSHILVFSYLEYSPSPAAVWRELNGLYSLAVDMGQQAATVIPPGGEAKKDATTITRVYQSLLLTSMVDPYHLPFGAIWEIFIQLRDWSEHARLKPFGRVQDPAGHYVIDLEGDGYPVPYGKFDTTSAGESHQLIDTTSLGAIAEKYLEQLNSGKALDKDLHLSPFYAEAILTQMELAWGEPAVRFSPRDKIQGSINVTCGINGVYYFLNGQQEFEGYEPNEEEHIITAAGGSHEPRAAVGQSYTMEQWDLIDQGPGGFSISKKGKPGVQARVGDLIGIMRGNGGDNTDGNLALGVIRWMMVSEDKTCRMGIQTIAAEMVPAAIRATTGSAMETRFSRAIIAGDFSPAADNVVITSAGMFKATREYELKVGSECFQVRSGTPVEATANFNHFIVAPLKQ